MDELLCDPYNILNLQKYYTLLKDLFTFELQAITIDEIKEVQFNEFKISDDSLPIYLPNGPQFYFFIKEMDRAILNDNTLDIDSIMFFIKNYYTYEMDTKISDFCFSLSFFYFNLPDNKYTIDDTCSPDLDKIKGIIGLSYKKYSDFMKSYKNRKDVKDKVDLFLENNIHINSFRDSFAKFTYNYYLTKMKPKKRKYMNITQKKNTRIKGGQRKQRTRKNIEPAL